MGTCQSTGTSDGRALVLLDGQNAVHALQVAAELPPTLLLGRRVVVVAGDSYANWLVGGCGASMVNVASGLAAYDSSSQPAERQLRGGS